MNDQPKQYALPVRPLINPLTENDLAALESVLARLPEIRDLIERAEACGIPVGDRREKHEAHHFIATQLHYRFFPKELPKLPE